MGANICKARLERQMKGPSGGMREHRVVRHPEVKLGTMREVRVARIFEVRVQK